MKCLAPPLLAIAFVLHAPGLAGSALAEADEGFVPLFDGTTLDGWEQHGGKATYQVEDGCIVGRVGPGPNSFTCTKKTYGDFILKTEVKLDVPGNSGIQVRSHLREQGDRVFGYQCEIDPSDRAWSGGIYDEGRRGWLFPLAGREEARQAFRRDAWNQFVIQAVGPSIRTWVNGVPCADLLDAADLEGFIALQVHSGKQGQIRWRTLRLKDLGRSQWKPLFNGKDLSGWDVLPGGQWTVEDGKIHGTSTADERRHGILISEKPYADFAVRVKYKAIKGNSGLYFRTEKGGGASVRGFQAEIDPNKDAGGLYETGGRAWVVKPKPEQVKKWFRPGEWNEMTVVAIGRDVAVHVNGHRTAELRNDPGRTEGYLGLQLHGGQDMDTWFEEVEILEITPEQVKLIQRADVP